MSETSEQEVLGQEQPESASLPEVQISQASSAKSSKPSIDVEQLKNELLAVLRPEIEKQWQSGKDSRWDKVEREYGKLSKISERVDKALEILDPEDRKKYEPAVRQRVVEQVLDEVQSERSVSPRKDDGNQQFRVATDELLDIFVEAGIAENAKAAQNSPEYMGFFQETGFKFDSEMDMAKKAVTYFAKLSGKQPKQPSAAAIAQVPGRSGTATPKQGELEEQYERLSRDPVSNKVALESIEKQLRDAGYWN